MLPLAPSDPVPPPIPIPLALTPGSNPMLRDCVIWLVQESKIGSPV